jgi:hypothetical protein
MKILLTLLTLSVLTAVPSAQACKILLQKQKEIPAVNEETVLVLEYHQVHRNCPLSLDTIKVKADGMKILSATPWEETGSNTFLRKLNVKIEEADCSLQIKRSCKKGGLDEEIVVQTQK